MSAHRFRAATEVANIRLAMRSYAVDSQREAQTEMRDNREIARDLVERSRVESYNQADELEAANFLEDLTSSIGFAAPIAGLASQFALASVLDSTAMTMIASQLILPTIGLSLLDGKVIGEPAGRAVSSGKMKGAAEAEARGKTMDLYSERFDERISRVNERIGEASDAVKREEAAFLETMRRSREAQGLA